MAALSLLFRPGDALIVRGIDGLLTTLRVLRRKDAGYLLRANDYGDPVAWSDKQIHEAYRDRRLTHQPCNSRNLSAGAGRAFDKTWEFWPPHVRIEAQRRLAYARAALSLLPDHSVAIRAFEAAAEMVHSGNFEEWKREDIAEAIADFVRRSRINRTPTETELETLAPGPCRPSKETVRRWFRLWDDNGRDIRLLIPLYNERGARRKRHPSFPSEDVPDTYKLMRETVEDSYLGMPLLRKAAVYADYAARCKAENIVAVSDRTFRLFIRTEYDDRIEYEAHHGKKAAYLRYNVFERRKLPDRILAEVEVDHCLIDLIVVHPITGKTLGRPWLTVLMDRTSKVILGVHLSFQPPSYATLQRAAAHAMWPKDLRDSPGLKHDWPCHGVWDMLFTDNGKEFHSRSLDVTANLLDFTVVPLPAKQPWLKGMIERLWNTIGVQVFSRLEGATLSKAPDHYDPVKRAKYSLEFVKSRLLEWIVDEYHHTRHGTLKCTPMERWLELAAIQSVKSVPDFEHIVRLTGEIMKRKIDNVGVRWLGNLFVDVDPATGRKGDRLTALRSRRGGLAKDWLIRVDPFDIGEAWIFDDVEGEWISLTNTDSGISRGVSLLQHKVHRLIAIKTVEPGQPVTVRDIENAKKRAEDEVDKLFKRGASTATAVKAARYAGDPGYFTPMPGPLRPTPSVTVEPVAIPYAGPQLLLPQVRATAPVPEAVPAVRKPPAPKAGRKTAPKTVRVSSGAPEAGRPAPPDLQDMIAKAFEEME